MVIHSPAGDFAVCGRRERSAPPRRGGQKDRQPAVFYPLGTPTFPCLLVRRRPETGDRSECFGVRQSGYCCVFFSACSQFTDSLLLRIWVTFRRVGITVPTNSLALCSRQHLRRKTGTASLNPQVPSAVSRLTICAALSSPRGPSLALRAIHLVPHSAENCRHV